MKSGRPRVNAKSPKQLLIDFGRQAVKRSTFECEWWQKWRAINCSQSHCEMADQSITYHLAGDIYGLRTQCIAERVCAPIMRPYYSKSLSFRRKPPFFALWDQFRDKVLVSSHTRRFVGAVGVRAWLGSSVQAGRDTRVVVCWFVYGQGNIVGVHIGHDHRCNSKEGEVNKLIIYR